MNYICLHKPTEIIVVTYYLLHCPAEPLMVRVVTIMVDNMLSSIGGGGGGGGLVYGRNVDVRGPSPIIKDSLDFFSQWNTEHLSYSQPIALALVTQHESDKSLWKYLLLRSLTTVGSVCPPPQPPLGRVASVPTESVIWWFEGERSDLFICNQLESKLQYSPIIVFFLSVPLWSNCQWYFHHVLIAMSSSLHRVNYWDPQFFVSVFGILAIHTHACFWSALTSERKWRNNQG